MNSHNLQSPISNRSTTRLSSPKSEAHERLQFPIRILLPLILLLAFALRLYRLDFQELRGDEAFGYFFSLRPLAELVPATVALQEPHPVASYFVQHIWLGWTGHSEFALRFLNVWFGMLAVALLYRLGRRLELAAPACYVATFLFAISPYAIWHSQDARMYSMSLALTLASTWLAVEWLPKQRWPQAVAYIAVSWLALHTHYFSIFVLLAQSAFVLSRALLLRRMWLTVSSWLTLQGMLGVLYLPWLARVGDILTGYGGNGDSPRFLDMLPRALSVFAVGESVPLVQRALWAGLAGVLLLIGGLHLAHNGPAGRRALWLFALYLAVPLGVTWYSAQQRPIFNERYLIAAAPPFYLLLGTAFDWGRTPKGHPMRINADKNRLVNFVSMLLLFVLLLGMVFSLDRHYADPAYSKTRGWRGLAATLRALSAGLPTEQVRIAQNFPDPTLWYYYTGPVEHIVLPPAAQDVAGAQTSVEQLAAAGVQRIILPVQPAPQWDDQAIAANALAARYSKVFEQTVGVWPVQIYALPPVNLMPINATFRNGITLASVAWQPLTLTPGGLLTVHLQWQGAAQELTGSEKIFLQLLTAAGQLVAQDDRPLDLTAALATYGILLPADLPTGDYRLIAGLYDPDQAGMPRVLTLDGADAVGVGEMLLAR